MRADPSKIVARSPGLIARVASVAGGILILKHEVYDTEEAQLFVIGLGLWLIGIPPALWLEALRKSTAAINGQEDRNGERRNERSSRTRRGK